MLRALRDLSARVVMSSVPASLREHIFRVWVTTVGFAAVWYFGGTERSIAPVFSAMKAGPLSMHVWGLGFFACSAVMAIGILAKNTKWITRALVLTGAMHLFIMTSYFLVACQDERASFAGTIAFGSIGWSVLSAAYRLGAKPTVIEFDLLALAKKDAPW